MQVAEYCNDAIAGTDAIPGRLFKKQVDIAVPLILTCEKGTGVLVFVSGLAEIDAFSIRLSKYKHVKIAKIHSDLEEERRTLMEQWPHHIHVILATNAAESSITLPDVNVVICLGTCNLETYDSTQFARTVLRNSWISHPSAAQRAGRTGRVRDGTVYHLYTRALHDNKKRFKHSNPPAMQCKPLHDVIVRVLGCLGGGYFEFSNVRDLLERLIAPPALDHLQHSLEYLHEGDIAPALTMRPSTADNPDKA
jgi:HrpA-like RNA helicase